MYINSYQNNIILVRSAITVSLRL